VKFWGPLYRETTEPLLTPEVSLLDGILIASKLQNLPVGPVVDLGCGNGRHLAHVKEKTGREVIGVDFDVTSLEEAQKTGCKTVQADFANLPFEDAQIAAVYSWCNTVYCLQPTLRRQTLVEVARVLAPGGLFLFQSIGPEWAQQMTGEHTQQLPNGTIIEEASFYKNKLKLKRWFKRSSDGKIMVGHCELYCFTDAELVKELAFFDLKIREITEDGPTRVVVAARV